jgi:hypothetical protein
MPMIMNAEPLAVSAWLVVSAKRACWPGAAASRTRCGREEGTPVRCKVTV